jgi:bacteriorhodopsin
MNVKKIFYNTLIISIIVQVITGIIQVGTFFLNVPMLIIKQLMILDLFVQLLEGTFYVWLSYNFKVSNITPKRYIDWMITTPTMLITLILYLLYLNTENKTQLNFFQMLKNNSNVIVPVLCLNWVMLLFGYLSEIKYIPVLLGVGLGFVPFLMYYYIIYVHYVTQYTTIFWYFFFFWALYGVVALLPYYLKNACYNILDLFSKNFFGLFLSYLIISGNY